MGKFRLSSEEERGKKKKGFVAGRRKGGEEIDRSATNNPAWSLGETGGEGEYLTLQTTIEEEDLIPRLSL